MNQKAITLVELLVGLVVATIGIIFVIQAFKSQSSLSKAAVEKQSATADLMEVAVRIQDVGRTARKCDTIKGYLRCQLDLNRPLSGVLGWVRFVIVNNPSESHLEYQKDTGTLGNFPSYTLIQKFSNITELSVCGQTELTADTCNLEPTAFNAAYNGLGLWNRFFRFRLGKTYQEANQQTKTSHLQAAFFLRTSTAMLGTYFE